MEMGGQEKEIRTPGSLSYNPLIREPSEGERRRDDRGIDNRTTIFNLSQTLDHRHHFQQQEELSRQQHSQGQTRDPNPNQVFGAVPISGATIAPISGGSNSKTPLTASSIRYQECLKNHAASVGGNVVDGCREFMPSGEVGTLEALKCAACNCHRNFHRKEVDGVTRSGADFRRSMVPSLQLQLHPPLPPHQMVSMGFHTNTSTANIVAPINMAFGGSGAIESSSEELNVLQSNVGSKKRFRTKFTQEQKDKMLEFAEKVGWRLQKQDEEEVQKVCTEVGVKRQVLKVWMHNNKNSMKQQQPLLHQ